MNDVNDLPQGAGENDALKPKENFERRPHRGDAYFVHLVRDIYRTLPWMPKAARRFAYNLIEMLEHDVLNGPVWGDPPSSTAQAFDHAATGGRLSEPWPPAGPLFNRQ